MADRSLIKAELQNLQRVLEQQAEMSVGNGKMRLLSFAHVCSSALELLKKQPITNTIPVKHGTWIPLDTNVAYDIIGVKTWALRARCSACGFVKKFIEAHTGQYVYCPNCGAKMDLENKDENC